MATLLNELSQLIYALDEHEIEYAVCGGLSMAIHGCGGFAAFENH